MCRGTRVSLQPPGQFLFVTAEGSPEGSGVSDNRVTDSARVWLEAMLARVSCWVVMQANPPPGSKPPTLLLGVDTCGPSGSVALGRFTGQDVQILGEIELEGRTYSSTLVAAIGELLAKSQIRLKDIDGIVAVNGPGSFTGVRVGLSAVKGLADGAAISIVALSRLAVLANKAGLGSSALDAHRHEVFLRVESPGQPAQELLAGLADLASISAIAGGVAVCDEPAAALLTEAWDAAELVRVTPPTAADGLRLAVASGEISKPVDLALLDGNYLRRSDAEIFGEPASTGKQPA